MRLDRFDAQPQARRDLLGRLPLRDALDDLALAGGQRVPWQGCPAQPGLHQRGRDPRTHIDRTLDYRTPIVTEEAEHTLPLSPQMEVAMGGSGLGARWVRPL